MILVRVDHIAIQSDFENTAVSLLQSGLQSEFLLDSCRQTGGFAKEASLMAIGNSDLSILTYVHIASVFPLSI